MFGNVSGSEVKEIEGVETETDVVKGVADL